MSLLPGPPPQVPELRCTNSANCTVGNGTGVYFAEGGKAGMGAMQLLITHFINGTGKVQFQGRYFDAGSGNWRTLDEPGNVTSATYNQRAGYAVVSVGEAATIATMPIWMLSDGSSTPTPVTGTDLGKLELSIAFQIPGLGTQQFMLSFTPSDRTDTDAKRQDTNYFVQTRSLSGPPAPADYCFDAAGARDPVVFQQGITVDPVFGTVTADATAVTMSCELGAPATVFRWGYEYKTPTAPALFYFAAGIHMKRDSYCGDFSYYTKAGTRIEYSDNHAPNPNFEVDKLEASWTPSGAVCANPNNARHGDIAHRANFTWQCNGKPLLRCSPPANPATAQYLVDAPETPIPF